MRIQPFSVTAIMMSLWTKLTGALGAFRIARAGNVAITFAIASLPIVGTVGFAVDYSHANSVKAAMQAALDSTALMLSKDAATTSESDMQAKALTYFQALFTRPEAKDIAINVAYATSGGSALTVNGTVNVPTTFLGMIGYNNIPVKGSSQSKWGSQRLRVALVLDTTGSMDDDGKITALKTATKNMLTQLQNAVTTDGDVYVSIIPFSRDVNVNPTNYDASWDSWIMWDDGTDQSWDGTNGTCSMSGSPNSPRSTCVALGTCSLSGYTTQNSCTGVGVCSISSYTNQTNCTVGICSNPGQMTSNDCATKKACSNPQYTSRRRCNDNGGNWDFGTWAATNGTWTPTPGTWTAATWTPNAHTTWNGCITDRGDSSAPSTANYDQNVVAPIPGTAASYYPAHQYNSCSQSVMGLNYNWSAMNSLVDSMTANGNTNQPIGLVWGWLSLVGGGPLAAPAKDSNYQYKEIIILLSDGLNTQDRWYSSQNSIDTRMYDSANAGAGTCANIKAAGVIIYAIQVNTGGDPTSTLLQSCATDLTKFFLLTSAGAIVTTFKTIGTNLTQLRVAK